MYKLSNNTIYGNDKSLFVSNGDHNLIEISGDSIALVTEVVKGFKEEKNIDLLFEELKNNFENDRSYFDEVCTWLINNRIIKRIDDDVHKEKKLEIKTFVNRNINQLKNDFFKLVSTPNERSPLNFIFEEELIKADLIILIAPLFENLEEILRINKYSFENKIPLCHIGIESSRTITLGPLVYSELRTPCINCYVKRKLTNLKNPQKIVSFIEHVNKDLINKSYETNNPWLKIAAIQLREELEIFFNSGKKISTLLGKSVVFDYNEYSVTKSMLLRTPACEVCNNIDRYSPFNI